jgi:hypothetical protein
MTKNRRTMMCGLGMALVLAFDLAPLRASDPIGVYGVVDRVVLTPNAGAPATAQVFGAFAVAVTPPTGSYQPAEAYAKVRTGYLLFTCEPANAAACRAEWKDLASLAGTGEVAGFGGRWAHRPRVREAGDPAVSPDTYAINIGVIKMGRFGDYPEIASALKAASPVR